MNKMSTIRKTSHTIKLQLYAWETGTSGAKIRIPVSPDKHFGETGILIQNGGGVQFIRLFNYFKILLFSKYKNRLYPQGHPRISM